MTLVKCGKNERGVDLRCIQRNDENIVNKIHFLRFSYFLDNNIYWRTVREQNRLP